MAKRAVDKAKRTLNKVRSLVRGARERGMARVLDTFTRRFRTETRPSRLLRLIETNENYRRLLRITERLALRLAKMEGRAAETFFASYWRELHRRFPDLVSDRPTKAMLAEIRRCVLGGAKPEVRFRARGVTLAADVRRILNDAHDLNITEAGKLAFINRETRKAFERFLAKAIADFADAFEAARNNARVWGMTGRMAA